MQCKILKSITFFAFLLLMISYINISTTYAADNINVGTNTYNGDDCAKIQKFLSQNSSVAGKTNGKMINASYDENNPTTWSGVTWTEDAVKRVKSISWTKKLLAGNLDISGIESIVLLYCDSNSLTGLDVSGDTNLTTIRCNSNKLTSLDLSTNIKLDTLTCHTNSLDTINLSTNTSLKYLYCYTNRLTSLDVSACTSLNELYCYSNLLTELDVGGITSLNKLACQSNKLTSLKLDGNTELTYLACYSNKLTEIDISESTKLTALHCYSNELINLNLSNNQELDTLYCNNNPLENLNLTSNTKLITLRCDLDRLTTLDISKNTELTSLQCNSNKLTTLDVSNNTKLSSLKCYSNQITELNLENNTNLTKLDCDTNNLTELDVSKNLLLTSLACYKNQLTSLDLSNNPDLIFLNCQENMLSELNIKNNKSLTDLFCYSNKLTTLDVSNNTELVNLRCYLNQISELKLDKNVALEQLVCHSNKFSELDVSNNTLLTILDCSSNQISELDVSKNKALTTLHCQINNLAALDVSSNELLAELWCYTNQINSLNISQNANLITVWCYENKLKELDLSKSKGLTYVNCINNILKDISVNMSNKGINIKANGNGYVELLRNSEFQFNVTAIPMEGSLFDSWSQAGTKVSTELLYNLIAGNSYELQANFSHNVKFDSQGGSNISDQIVAHQGKITEPTPEPTKGQFKFDGWYKEIELTNKWDFSTNVVLGDITLYAKWVDKNPKYTVTFNANGGSEVSSINDLTAGSYITEPTEPTKTECDFKGWYKEAELINKWNFSTDVISENITLYAKWEPKTYTVTFSVDGGSPVPSINNLTAGSSITEPAEPTKPECDFRGWYKEASLINKWDFDTDVVNGNITLFAMWTPKTYTVTFDTNGGSTIPSVTNIKSGSLITEPTKPTKFECDFKGWYKDSALTIAWNFETDKVMEETILYAKWASNTPAEDKYTVTFNTNGGSAVPSITNITSGSAITLPVEPTKAECEFKGWYKEAELINAWNFDIDVVNDNITLYAKWTSKKPLEPTCVVMFDTNGGTKVSAIKDIVVGNAIVEPSEPTKEEYNFAGWYKDSALTTAWNFDTDKVTEDTILYAKWVANTPTGDKYTVTFNSNGGSVVPSIINITSGSAITLPVQPTKAECEFQGWYKEAELINAWNFDIDVVNDNITLYAKWVPKKPVESTYIVMFDTNGGTKVTAIKDISEGSTITEPPKPTKDNYDFLGWYKNSALTILWDFKTDKVTEDTILYAKWTKRSSSSISSNTDANNNNLAPIMINGKTEYVATSVISMVDGISDTRIQIDGNKLSDKLKQVNMYPKIEVPISNDSKIKITELNGQTVKLLESKNSTIEIITGNVTYTLPADQINIDDIAEKMGTKVDLKDITVSIKISNASVEIEDLMNSTANKDNYQVVTKPVEFSITCSNNAKTIDVSKFSTYVTRTIEIPNSVDKITTGVVLNKDGTFSPVPTSINEMDGRYYANINSLTNSVYSVIWSQKSFKDVESHWSKDAVNDMGSRLVISGVESDIFEPNRDITRAEFTEIVVKGLGLVRLGTFRSSYNDVDKSAWYYNSLAIASEYGLISGYSNSKFAPNEKITREQAMTIISKAMKITGLDIEFKLGETEDILRSFGDIEQASHWSKESIAACVKTGIVSGRNGHMIAPNGNMTRAETAVIVRNLLKKSELI